MDELKTVNLFHDIPYCFPSCSHIYSIEFDMKFHNSLSYCGTATQLYYKTSSKFWNISCSCTVINQKNNFFYNLFGAMTTFNVESLVFRRSNCCQLCSYICQSISTTLAVIFRNEQFIFCEDCIINNAQTPVMSPIGSWYTAVLPPVWYFDGRHLD